MGMVRPTGDHADRMLEPGGWPDADEDVLYDRARRFDEVLREVTHVLETSREQRTQVFDGGIWSGAAADGAAGALDSRIDQLATLRDDLASAITWHDQVRGSVVLAKSYIGDNVATANLRIAVIESDTALEAEERTAAIELVVNSTLGANLGIVADTAAGIQSTTASRPSWDTPADVFDRPLVRPDGPRQDTPGRATVPSRPQTPTSTPGPISPVPRTPPTPRPQPSRPDDERTPSTLERPTPATTNQGGLIPGSAPRGPAAPVVPAATIPPASRPGPSTPADAAELDAAPLDAAPLAAGPDPVKAEQSGDPGGYGKGMAPASTVVAPVPPVRPDDPTSSGTGATPPTAPGGTPGGMMPAGAAGGGAASGKGSSSAAPIGGRPPDRQPSSTDKSQRSRPLRPTASAGRAEPPDRGRAPDVPVIAMIPVSAARAERDAIAGSSAAEAQRRQGAPDPVQLGRRIAAALNAPDRGGAFDFGFFWVTGVTTDGDVVVANSYGLAYIPDGVELPEPVLLATADDSIPVAERARWATYPMLAVSGWAAHHEKVLRAVIATEVQFGGFDPGVTRIVLAADDIPESGMMSGRSRLAVVAADTAQELAETADLELAHLLPSTPPEAARPADRRLDSWFDVMKPMASEATGREVAHLRAFHNYADHCRELALAVAFAAIEPMPRRAAIADWLYWTYLTELLHGALMPAA